VGIKNNLYRAPTDSAPQLAAAIGSRHGRHVFHFIHASCYHAACHVAESAIHVCPATPTEVQSGSLAGNAENNAGHVAGSGAGHVFGSAILFQSGDNVDHGHGPVDLGPGPEVGLANHPHQKVGKKSCRERDNNRSVENNVHDVVYSLQLSINRKP